MNQQPPRQAVDSGKPGNAIGADVLEKEIAERDMREAIIFRRRQRCSHSELVFVIGARAGDLHTEERQSGGGGLNFDEFAANRMHRDSIRRFIKRCQQAGYFEIRVLAKTMQRPGAILAGTPREQHAMLGH